MNRFALLVPLLLPACAGSVNVKGDAEPFGAVRSAVWLKVHSSSGELEPDESLVLTNVAGVCEKFEAYESAFLGWQEALAALTDTETACAEMEDANMEVALAGKELYREGANYTAISLSNDDGALGVGTYLFGEDPLGFHGTVDYNEGERYAAILEDYDPAGTLEDGCGTGEGELLGNYDLEHTWTFTDGEVVIHRFAEGKGVGGRVNATIEDDEGAEGEVVASFSAEWCEIDL